MNSNYYEDEDEFSERDLASLGSLMGDEIKELENKNSKLLDLIQEAILEIEYLHNKFQETGSGNTVVAKLKAAIEGIFEIEDLKTRDAEIVSLRQENEKLKGLLAKHQIGIDPAEAKERGIYLLEFGNCPPRTPMYAVGHWVRNKERWYVTGSYFKYHSVKRAYLLPLF